MRSAIGRVIGLGLTAGLLVAASGAEAACVKGVSKRDVLKLRAGPSARAAEVAGIPPTSCRIRVTGPCQSGWCPVSYEGQQGWARQQYIWVDTRPGPEGQAHARDPDAVAEREQMALMRPGARLPPEIMEPPPVDPVERLSPPREPPVAPRETLPPQREAAPAPAAVQPAPPPLEPPAAKRSPDPRLPEERAPVESKRAAVQPPLAVPKSGPEARSGPEAASGTKCAKGPGNGQRMRVRAAPGLSSDALYGIQPGTCGIEITGTCRANWCPISLGSYRGWVDRRELE